MLVRGLLSGISAGSGYPGFDWSAAFSVRYIAVIRGTILLGVSKILSLLKSKEP